MKFYGAKMRAPRLTYDFTSDPDRPAWVYAIQSGGEYIKIGMTASPMQRMKAMKLHNPHPLKLVMYRTVPKNIVRDVEQRVHELLAEWHHYGEWFTAPLHEVRRATKRAVFEAQKVHKMDLEMLWEQRRAATEALAAGENMNKAVVRALRNLRATFPPIQAP